ncbi:MAG: hypothetical protein NXI08_10180 [bacterium]|nr:hypothetical protein [bacterium]
MSLKNDWSLAHFLYYLSAFIIIGIIAQTITFHLPDITGQKTLQSNIRTDPPVAIDSDYFDLAERRIAFEDGAVFTLGSKVYAYPMFIGAEQTPAGSVILLILRIAKLLCLFLFYVMLNFILRSVAEKTHFWLKTLLGYL